METSRRAIRATARRRRSQRGAAIAALSTVVVIGGLAALVVTSPGWSNVQETFFSRPDFERAFPDVLEGFWLDVRMFCVIEVVVLVLGLVVALTRTSHAAALFPLRMLAAVYTDLLRGVPTILLVFLVGFGVPALELSGLPTDPVILGGAALALSYSAYVAEVYRAGIESVHPSQVAAARSLGLSRWKSLRFVVLPQAVRRVIPPLLNDFIGLQKDTALVSVLGSIEAARAAQIYGASEFNYASYVIAALLFVLITIPLARFTDRLIARDKRRRQAGGLA